MGSLLSESRGNEVGKGVGLSLSKERMVARSSAVDEGWAPGPMKPNPPDLEISRARWGPDMMRMGAPMMEGCASQGNVLEREVGDLNGGIVVSTFSSIRATSRTIVWYDWIRVHTTIQRLAYSL